MEAAVVKEGDWVLIYFSEKKSYVVRVEQGRQFHTTKGSIDLGSLVGVEYGSRLETNVGEEFYVTRPLIVDRLSVLKRFTQVIYPKDLAYLLLGSGVGPGSRVVEAGTGTGYLTSILAFYVRPSGRVFTYEAREDFYKMAVENFERIGLLPYITVRKRNIKEGIKERNVDAVFLDMPDPWEVFGEAYSVLNHGGTINVFTPTTGQMSRSIEGLKRAGFKRVEAAEIMYRRYKASPRELRPENVGIWHTGYIIRGQKL